MSDQNTKQTHARIWAIAWPSILANSSAPIAGLIDTWAIGQMSSGIHLAAIGMGVVVFNYIFWAFGFLRMGTTGLIAQAKGAEDDELLVQTLLRSAFLALVIGVVLIVLQDVVWYLSLKAMTPPGDIPQIAFSYFEVRLLAAPATLLVYTLSGALIGLQKARHMMLVQILLNAVNAALNVLFVVVLGMGVVGVALGTVIAQYVAAIVGVIIMLRLCGVGAFYQCFLQSSTWLLGSFKHLIAVNGYIFLRTLLLLTAMASLIQISGSIGVKEMAAAHIMTQFIILLSLGLDGFANAAEALVGAAWGKKDKALFSHWVKYTNIWAVIASVFYALVFALFGNSLAVVLTNDIAIQGYIASIMPVIVLIPLIAVWSYQYDGIFIAITAGKAMFVTMTIAFTAYFSVVFIAVEQWGFLGLWLAYVLFLAVRGLSQKIWLSRFVVKAFSEM